MPIKIMVADDHDIFRKGLIDTLKGFDEIEVTGDAGNGQELLAQLKFSMPDIVLLDIEMPVMNGYEVLERLKEEAAEVKVIVISVYDECRVIARVVRAGARGFLAKNVNLEELYTAILMVARTGFYFNERLSRALAKEIKEEDITEGPAIKAGAQAVFTDKELKILYLLAAEKTSQDIGRELGLSVRTVDGIRRRMIQKAGAKNVIGLFLYAFQNGLL